MPRAWVMVLGDLGRSPRMSYHTLSLCKTPGYEVCLIGQRGSELIEDLQAPRADGRLAVHYVPDMPRWLARLPGPLRLPLKALFQLVALLWMLLVALPRPDVILLQLPPALPTMLVCKLAALRHRARLVFDWHNFAYTLMAIGMGARHPLVRLAEAYERYWGRTANASLCVTAAMQRELQGQWRVPGVTVFHDAPPDFFRPATLGEAHALLQRLQPALAAPMHPHDFCAAMCAELCPGQTICTEEMEAAPQGDGAGGGATASGRSKGGKGRRGSGRVGGAPGELRLRADRPALVVSSTSWTPDEDFGPLLQAAQLYDTKARRSRQALPHILFLITGRGPQRAAYEEKMRQLDLRHVAFRTLWLEPGDYPLLLGAVDLGVCLHASSSGLDLPMKVVDMFGAGLPVTAVSYPCIGEELVREDVNGLLFSTPQQLAQQFADLFAGFPAAAAAPQGGQEAGAPGLLAQLRAGVRGRGALPRWHDSWRRTVLPVLEGRS